MNCPDYVSEIIKKLCKDNIVAQSEGCGPFAAAICDKDGNVLVATHNSVMSDNCSLNHAEINAIREIQKKLKTYDLSKYDLSICVTAEPCAMCLGAIMWSGIKNIYYGLSSCEVEKITGFDEGYKPGWIDEFKKRNINAAGNIEIDSCTKVLVNYVNSGNVIYKPER